MALKLYVARDAISLHCESMSYSVANCVDATKVQQILAVHCQLV